MEYLLRDYYNQNECNVIRRGCLRYGVKLKTIRDRISSREGNNRLYKLSVITKGQFDELIARVEEKYKRDRLFYTRESLKNYKKLRGRLDD